MEHAERSLREALFRRHPEYAALRGTAPATIREVRKRLRPNQAMLSFQVSKSPREPEGGPAQRSWGILITKSGARAVPLHGCADLDRRIRLFLSLLQRRNGIERPGAERLYGDLLAELLIDLPTGIKTLIVIPDGPLHRLPFGTLADPARHGSLTENFEIFVAPSAATWLRLTEDRPRSARLPMLALAAPQVQLSEAEQRSDGESTPLLRPGWAPGPLPHAEREALGLAGQAGPGSRVILGAGATEAAFKSADLSRFRLIHLATHAVVNDEFPERSAVLLEQDSEEGNEDGLLGFGEIVQLDLNGPLVVLSSCSSASGPLIGGEGVLGLANAFFHAGARAVVAGLWPVRDRETAALIDRFGEHLSQGRSVSEAMTQARRDLIRRGSPPAAWAGMVVLGDGDLAPWPRGNAEPRWLSWPLALVALLLLAALVVKGVRNLFYNLPKV